MPRAHETLVVVLQQRLVLVTADLVHDASEEAGEVVLVKDDTLVRVGPQPTRDRAQLGARHVHGHRVAAGPFCCREPVEEAAERGCRASVRDEEGRRLLGITDDGHVLVPLLERRFIDTHHLGDRQLRAGESPVQRALHNARHLVPAHVEQLGDGLDARMLQPLDDQTLEEGGEPRPRSRPWHLHLPSAMRWTVDAGNLRNEHGLVLHRVEVPP